jgi:hypothetical protein
MSPRVIASTIPSPHSGSDRRLGRGARRRPLHGYLPSWLSLSAAGGTTKAAPAAMATRSRTRPAPASFATVSGIPIADECHDRGRAPRRARAWARRDRMSRRLLERSKCFGPFGATTQPQPEQQHERRDQDYRPDCQRHEQRNQRGVVGGGLVDGQPRQDLRSLRDTPPGDDCAHRDSGLSSWVVFP